MGKFKGKAKLIQLSLLLKTTTLPNLMLLAAVVVALLLSSKTHLQYIYVPFSSGYHPQRPQYSNHVLLKNNKTFPYQTYHLVLGIPGVLFSKPTLDSP